MKWAIWSHDSKEPPTGIIVLKVNKTLIQQPHYVVDPRFRGANRHSKFLFENETNESAHTGHYLQKTELKYLN